jgi:hypothetical protein
VLIFVRFAMRGEHAFVWAPPDANFLLIIPCNPLLMAKVDRQAAVMSGNSASAKNDVTEPSTQAGAAAPTGYRIALVPGVLEVSARLATTEELRNLVKLLQASIVIFDNAAQGDTDSPLSLTERVAKVSPANRT